MAYEPKKTVKKAGWAAAGAAFALFVVDAIIQWLQVNPPEWTTYTLGALVLAALTAGKNWLKHRD